MRKKTAAVETEDPAAEQTSSARKRFPKLPANVNDAVNFVAENRAALFSIAEQVLFSYAPEISLDSHDGPKMAYHLRHYFDADAMAVFDSLGWDEDRIRRELGRCQNILQLQFRAGTTADREAAAGKLDAAREALGKRKPAIEEQLTQLNRELAELEQAAKAAETEVYTRNDAVEKLRDKVPSHVDDSCRRERLGIANEFRQPIADAQEELLEANRLAAPPPPLPGQPALPSGAITPEKAAAIKVAQAKIKKLEDERDAQVAEVRKKHLDQYAR